MGLAGWLSAAPRVLKTRHPSNDMQRRFMAEGSHFAQTADLIDWWAIGAAWERGRQTSSSIAAADVPGL